ITRDSYQELLSTVQQRLHTVNEEKIKVDKHLGELQKVLPQVEKGLDAWTSKKKKTTTLIEERQKKLSENQESATTIEDEIYANEKISSLFETKIKELAKAKGRQ
ncbi:hypothetical protein HAX54_023181, partial [Datura stramonium]|nr:hypothetical protein [Datura stramonium]